MSEVIKFSSVSTNSWNVENAQLKTKKLPLKQIGLSSVYNLFSKHN